MQSFKQRLLLTLWLLLAAYCVTSPFRFELNIKEDCRKSEKSK